MYVYTYMVECGMARMKPASSDQNNQPYLVRLVWCDAKLFSICFALLWAMQIAIGRGKGRWTDKNEGDRKHCCEYFQTPRIRSTLFNLIFVFLICGGKDEKKRKYIRRGLYSTVYTHIIIARILRCVLLRCCAWSFWSEENRCVANLTISVEPRRICILQSPPAFIEQ